MNRLRALLSLKTIAVIAGCGVILPLLVILVSTLQPEKTVWHHIVDTLLIELLMNTFTLCIGVMVVFASASLVMFQES